MKLLSASFFLFLAACTGETESNELFSDPPVCVFACNGSQVQQYSTSSCNAQTDCASLSECCKSDGGIALAGCQPLSAYGSAASNFITCQ